MTSRTLPFLLLSTACQIYVDYPCPGGLCKDGADTAGPDTDTTDTDTTDTDTTDTDTSDTDTADTDTADDLSDAACVTGVAAWNLGSGATSPTIQGAIDAAAAGDTVVICPGTWTEALVAPAWELTLRGYGAASTVLDGGDSALIVDVPPDATLTVWGLTLQHGFPAVNVAEAAVALRGVRVSECRGLSGGGVEQEGGSLTIEWSVFEGNESAEGGGAVRFATGGSPHAEITVRGSTFTGNVARAYDGGALDISTRQVPVTAIIDGSTFEGNLSPYVGGAIVFRVDNPAATLAISSSTFTENAASEGGALGLDGWMGGTVTVDDATFDGNVGYTSGGGINLGVWGDHALTVTGSTFTRNDGRVGGALNIAGGGSHTVRLESCAVSANTAAGGAAFYVEGGLTIVGGSVTENEAMAAGGLGFTDTAVVSVTNSDWGTGATDNIPEDVNELTVAYGAEATFSCEAGICE